MKTVSLVLSGGAARGYAHIGVIKVLEDMGFKINAISGCSMGALIGGLYATGKLEEYVDWVSNLSKFDMVRLLDFTISGGLIKGDKIFEHLRSIVGDVKIEELPIKFTAVAVDITKRREFWFQEGDLLEAVRASVAIPSVFTPVEIGGHLFVDGGVLNLLPIAPLMSVASDYIIAVNVNAPIECRFRAEDPLHIEHSSKLKQYFVDVFSKQKKTDSIFDIASVSVEIMQDAIVNYRVAEYKPDVVINVSKEACDLYDFHKILEMIDIGKKAAREELSKLSF
ncbi:patatin-like phospholipase family protein [Hippea jasoniae]|uniref:patatin-like phospholipase family protein n=1 Tax=Hippea jasoniae TaxID=944479 RepID=UPI000554F35F|nr:patatin-like phospholipase family protein [Hippea jasoniae]